MLHLEIRLTIYCILEWALKYVAFLVRPGSMLYLEMPHSMLYLEYVLQDAVSLVKPCLETLSGLKKIGMFCCLVVLSPEIPTKSLSLPLIFTNNVTFLVQAHYCICII